MLYGSTLAESFMGSMRQGLVLSPGGRFREADQAGRIFVSLVSCGGPEPRDVRGMLSAHISPDSPCGMGA